MRSEQSHQLSQTRLHTMMKLPASILKRCTDSYLQPLTHLINLSISLGIVPDELKVARVIPIFKGED